MANTYGTSIESNSQDRAGARRTVAADKSFLEVCTIASQPAGQCNFWTDYLGDARHKLAAIDVQTVGQDEHTREIICIKRAPNRLAAGARLVWLANILLVQSQRGRIKADGRSNDFIVADIAVVDLTAGAASQDKGLRIHVTQLLVACAAGKQLACAEIQDE